MPVVLGIAIAATHGFFDPLTALLTVIGASFVQLAINVSNDVFDTAQGADDANVTPTQFSGGSRVIQYGLVSFRQMATLAFALYLAAAAVGLVLLALRGSPALLVIGVLGFVVGLGYTAPPLKLVYRGLGESLRSEFKDWRAAVIVSDDELGHQLGLRADKRYVLYNGAIECRLLVFDLAAEAPRASVER